MPMKMTSEPTEILIERIVKNAGPVKPVGHPFLLSAKWLAGMGVYLVLISAIYGTRPDLTEKFQSLLFGAEIGLLAAMVITTSMSTALLSFPDLYQKRMMAWAPVGIAIPFILLMCVANFSGQPASAPPIHSFQCTFSIAFLALLPALVMFYSVRKIASTHPYLVGAIALLCAFSVGALSLRLYEPTDSILHVIQWHYLPMIGVSILGVWLGKKFLNW